jgi:hypothetical protein
MSFIVRRAEMFQDMEIAMFEKQFRWVAVVLLTTVITAGCQTLGKTPLTKSDEPTLSAHCPSCR